MRYRQPNGLTSRKRGFTLKRDASVWASKVETPQGRGRLCVAGARQGDRRRSVGRMVGPAGADTLAVLLPHRLVRLRQARRTQVGWRRGEQGGQLGRKGVGRVHHPPRVERHSGNRAVGILAGILDDAIEHRSLAFNPARRFKRGEKPKKSPKRHVYLTEEDVCRLAEESGRHADLVLTLAFTGLRWGEAIALTVADVKFLKRRIALHRNAVQVGQDFEVGQTKGKENRTVPVAASVLSRLAVRCEGRSAGDLLFPARGGGYLKRPSYDSTGWFNRAVERAQVQKITPH